MRRAASLALLGLLPLGASAQEGPSFDCAKASTLVESAICADWTLSAFDRWVGQLYKGLSKRLGPDDLAKLKADQRAWLKDERNACATAKSQDPSVPDDAAVWSCLYAVYETRAIQLAQLLETADGPEGPWSGSYSLDDGHARGSLLLLAMADESFTLQVSSVTGPGEHICDLTLVGGTPAEGGLHFELADDPACRVQLERLGDGQGTLSLASEGCQDYCGAYGYFTGEYRAVRPNY